MTHTPDPASATPDAPPSPADSPDEVEVLKARLADAETRAAGARESQLRALADLDNTRRRLERDAAANLKYAAEKLLGELLAVADSLELGLQAAGGAEVRPLVEGMQLTHKQLMTVLEKHGVKPLDPKGELFNPESHQAMSMVETGEVPPNHVAQVMQKGYRLHDRLLRPATVIVARPPAAR